MFEKICKTLWPEVEYQSPKNDATAFLIALEMVNRGWGFKIRTCGDKKVAYLNSGDVVHLHTSDTIESVVLTVVGMALGLIETITKVPEKVDAPLVMTRKRGRPRKNAEPV